MSEENITIEINNNYIEEPKWCQTILVNLVCCVIGVVIIFCNEKTKVKVCLELITLVIFVVINILFYLSHLYYKTKFYNSTLSVIKTTMVLEKQNENKENQFGKVNKVTIDGEVIFSVKKG